MSKNEKDAQKILQAAGISASDLKKRGNLEQAIQIASATRGIYRAGVKAQLQRLARAAA